MIDIIRRTRPVRFALAGALLLCLAFCLLSIFTHALNGDRQAAGGFLIACFLLGYVGSAVISPEITERFKKGQ